MRPASSNIAASDVNSATPQRLDAFVGQRAVVEAVRVALQASRISGATYPSSLFVGPPGLGKSQLVQLIAAELQVPLRETLAQTLEQASDLHALLLEARSRDVIFIDEADELHDAHQVLLYRALAERRLFLPRGRSTSAANSLPLDDFTLIMASNHESRLARPLVERFKMIARFEFYDANEVLSLLTQRAASLGWRCHYDVLPVIAQRSRGVPRTGLRVLESVHRVAVSQNARVMTISHVQRACEIDGIDELGLDRTERAYLALLHDEPNPVRLGVVADRLGLPPRTIMTCIEPYLIRLGFVSRSEAGRSLTPRAIEHLRRADR